MRKDGKLGILGLENLVEDGKLTSNKTFWEVPQTIWGLLTGDSLPCKGPSPGERKLTLVSTAVHEAVLKRLHI